MKEQEGEDRSQKRLKVKYNWFQISNILKLSFYNREVVRMKYFDEELTEDEWCKKLKKDRINF